MDVVDPIQTSFIQALRGIASTVSIISCKDNLDKQAMTATSIASLSLEPPSMLVCVNKESSIHRIMKEGSIFCINVMNRDQKDIAEICSIRGNEDRRFDLGNWEEIEEVPFNKDSQSNIFCICEKLVNHNTHTLFIGKVVKVINNMSADPLVYKDGKYL